MKNMKTTKHLGNSETPPHVEDMSFEPLYETARLDMNKTMLKPKKLLKMVHEFGEFPSKYRFLIWRFMLSLPHNKEGFENLIAPGVHEAYINLHERHPVCSYRVYSRLVRHLSALANWCSICAEMEFLPSMVYPFVKLISEGQGGGDDLVLFETLLCLIIQIC
jgi:hypothetical protein